MRIAILDDYQHVALDLADWETLDSELEVFHESLGDEHSVVRRLREYEVIVAMRERTPFPEMVLRRLPNLRLLVTTGPSNRAIDLAAARDLGIVVSATNSGSSTTELTWALILAASRHLPSEMRSMIGGGWQTAVGMDLCGRTLGLMGLGRLGTQVARIGHAFGMHTMAWSQNLTPEHASALGVEFATKDELLACSDVLTVHLALSERTRGLVGARELALMKSTALLVNTSRGPIVDEHALLVALRERRIGGAALDVFDKEPLPANHPLRLLDNVVLTPHIGYVTWDTYAMFYQDALADIVAWMKGSPIRVLS